jgi:translation initiation factor IF-2
MTEPELFPLVPLPVPKGKFMKKQTDQTPKTEEGFDLKVRSRDSKPVIIHIPADTLASLEKIAAGRDMSVEALLKLYIGQSMRQDLAKLSADRVLEKTAEVLTRHIESKEEVPAILKEIRVETVS